jgi:HK97 family phage prohead protease
MSVVHKVTLSTDADGRLFVLSDDTPDNYSDIVGDRDHPALGWNLETFKKNPIALWSHDSKEPIGKWINPRIENGALKAQLVLAPVGVNPRIDELRSLIDCGILRGVSVGFMPTRSQPLASGGTHYLRQTLVEASLCSVPANPSALLQAKKLGVGTDLIRKVFKQGVSFANAEAIARSRQPKLLSVSPEATERATARAAKDAYNRATLVRARAMLAKSKQRAGYKRVKNSIDPDDYNTEDGFMHDCIEELLRQGGYDDRLEASKACKVRWEKG